MIECVWEHNGDDTILYARQFVGAFTRGESLAAAKAKMQHEIKGYCRWAGCSHPVNADILLVQEKSSELNIRDADSDVIFDSELLPMTWEEYSALKNLAMKSAADFQALYDSVPDRNKSCLPARRTFYGSVPRTAEEMYQHTKNVNEYYFREIGVDADNEGSIAQCRARGFEILEAMPDFLSKSAQVGSYGESWSRRKLLRRFLWHDRIHAKAMYRMAVRTFGKDSVPNVFCVD